MEEALNIGSQMMLPGQLLFKHSKIFKTKMSQMHGTISTYSMTSEYHRKYQHLQNLDSRKGGEQ